MASLRWSWSRIRTGPSPYTSCLWLECRATFVLTSEVVRWAAALFVVAGMSVSTALAASGLSVSPDLDRACGPVRSVSIAEGVQDYRASPDIVKAVDHFHTDLAAKELDAGQLNLIVKQNLEFTLRTVPNHIRALQMLIRYEIAGGKEFGLPRTECYLSWARQFAPNDESVYVVGGYFFWKKHDAQRAEEWWQGALAINPHSADANYNLGLLYAEKGNYDAALKCAKAAYAAGYPLQGLRRALERAGRWETPSSVVNSN